MLNVLFFFLNNLNIVLYSVIMGLISFSDWGEISGTWVKTLVLAVENICFPSFPRSLKIINLDNN